MRPQPEAPVGPGVEELRDGKERVFAAMETLKPDDLVRGQFVGYRDEAGVAPQSDVETFAAVRLHIDSWRWAGVPFYLRAGKKLPVNLVLVCEGEEEIASPHFSELVHSPAVLAGLKKCIGIFMPEAGQERDGGIQVALGAKGVVELELVSSGEKWGRGPKHDVHSSLEAELDSPSWHLVQALNTLVGPDGHTPAIEHFADKARPLNATEKAQIRDVAARMNEQMTKQQMGVQHWVHDVDFLESLELLVGRPTVNIEGLVGGYTGPGGKTILPHRAVAKLDLHSAPSIAAVTV